MRFIGIGARLMGVPHEVDAWATFLTWDACLILRFGEQGAPLHSAEATMRSLV